MLAQISLSSGKSAENPTLWLQFIREERPQTTWRKSQGDLSILDCLVTQSCLTLCDPKDCGPPGSSVHGILQARILKWVAMSSSRGSSQLRDRTQVSRIAGWFFTICMGTNRVSRESHQQKHRKDLTNVQAPMQTYFSKKIRWKERNNKGRKEGREGIELGKHRWERYSERKYNARKKLL